MTTAGSATFIYQAALAAFGTNVASTRTTPLLRFTTRCSVTARPPSALECWLTKNRRNCSLASGSASSSVASLLLSAFISLLCHHKQTGARANRLFWTNTARQIPSFLPTWAGLMENQACIALLFQAKSPAVATGLILRAARSGVDDHFIHPAGLKRRRSRLRQRLHPAPIRDAHAEQHRKSPIRRHRH